MPDWNPFSTDLHNALIYHLGNGDSEKKHWAQNVYYDQVACNPRRSLYGSVVNSFAPPDSLQWHDKHLQYLKKHVGFENKNTGFVPHTFNAAFIAPADVKTDTMLFRMVELESFKRHSGSTLTLDQLRECADFNIGHINEASFPLDRAPAISSYLDDFLGKFAVNCDNRPLFACPWEDICKDSRETNWADRFRDRLGLSHMDPPSRMCSEINILGFIYRLGDVECDLKTVPLAKTIGAGSPHIGVGEIPVAIPSQLDSGLFSAFHPACILNLMGYAVNLCLA